MKKALIKFIAVVALALASAPSLQAAEGEITFFTPNANTSLGRVFQTDGTTRLDSSFLGQLYVSDSLSGTYVALGSPVAWSNSGNINSSTFTIAGTTPNVTTYFYKVAAWTAASGASFETASVSGSGMAGISAGTQFTVGGTVTSPTPGVITANSNEFANFSLSNVAAVPEPTTIALGVLGGLGMLARRRRNAA